MLRKMSIRKIIISSLTLFVLLLIYLIPSNKEEENPSLEVKTPVIVFEDPDEKK